MADINNEKCCTCTTPEITIKLNKQGPQGLTGPKGEDGFSPIINVGENTYSTYTLNITDANGSFTTPNLKASLPSGGVKGDVLMKNSSVDGDVSFNTLPSASTSEAGIVQLATINDFATDPEDGEMVDGGYTDAVTPYVMVEYLQGNYQPKGDYVTVDTKQTVTGAKTFVTDTFTDIFTIANQQYINNTSGKESLQFSPGDIDYTVEDTRYNLLSYNFNNIHFGGLATDTILNSNGNVKVYRYGEEGLDTFENIDSGNWKNYIVLEPATTTTLGLVKPDGTTITITEDGTISSTGGSLPDDVLTSENISQDNYIKSLVARIVALETEINGGNA